MESEIEKDLLEGVSTAMDFLGTTATVVQEARPNGRNDPRARPTKTSLEVRAIRMSSVKEAADRENVTSAEACESVMVEVRTTGGSRWTPAKGNGFQMSGRSGVVDEWTDVTPADHPVYYELKVRW